MPITLTSENFKDLLANIDQFVFWDTVGLFFWRLPAGLCRRLEAIYRRPVIPQRDKRTGAYILLFHQPWPQLLQVLDDVQRQHHATVCRADLAADFVTSWVLIEPLKRFLLTYVILRWRWPGPMHDWGDGYYWTMQVMRRRFSNRDLLLYADRPSKVPAAPHRPCNHLEIKLQTAKACRANGILRPTDLLDIDPHEFFAKHIAFAADSFEQHLQRIIEQRTKQRWNALPNQRSRADWNRTHAEVEHDIITRLQLDRAQRMKDLYPDLVQMMRIPDDMIPHTLTFIKPYPDRPVRRRELRPTGPRNALSRYVREQRFSHTPF
jgi:hypothetical protein